MLFTYYYNHYLFLFVIIILIDKVCRITIIICVSFAFITNSFKSLNQAERENKNQIILRKSRYIFFVLNSCNYKNILGCCWL